MSKATDLIKTFIAAMNAVDPEAARKVLAPGATLVFPGDIVFPSIEAFFDWAASRYNNGQYSYHAFEEVALGGKTIVYARGTMAGYLTNGTLFSGVRIIDRFELRDGLIHKKEVWSDMADFLRGIGL